MVCPLDLMTLRQVDPVFNEGQCPDKARLEQLLRKRDLFCVYQPIINLHQGGFHAWEALTRIPVDYGFDGPMDLFDTARDTQLLAAIEQLSREKAIQGYAQQQLPGKLFMNITPDVLMQPDHRPGITLARMAQMGLSPQQMVIELTEHHPTHDFELMRRAIQHYRDAGFEIALDDLGAGYSGLRLWSEISPDYVKVDRHFVHQAPEDKVKQDFLRFILNIAQSLGTRVIAEGVETAAELQLLEEMGYELVQGYYLARPSARPMALIGETQVSLT